MVKYFCDNCGKETEKNYVTNSLELQGERIRIVLSVSLDAKFSGMLCAECLLVEIHKHIS